jgi:hypothetical protein
LSCTPADDAEIVAARVAAKQAELREARNPDLVLQEPPTRNQTTTSSAWRFGYVFQCPEGYKWGCLANEKCMALVSIKSRTSFVLTACTDHLRDVHGVGKSAAQAAAAARRVEQVRAFPFRTRSVYAISLCHFFFAHFPFLLRECGLLYAVVAKAPVYISLTKCTET